MVEQQLRRRGLTDERVLRAMQSVPRERFIPERMRDSAYADGALPIGEGQTISQPYMVARTCELAQVKPADRVLEVGAGSGYQAAILGQLAELVIGIEIVPELAERARALVKSLGYDNVEILTGDGTLGHIERAPYDVIVVAAGAPSVPPALLAQLADGGRLVIPVGSDLLQVLTVLRRTPDGIERQAHDGCVFVPLRGDGGW